MSYGSKKVCFRKNTHTFEAGIRFRCKGKIKLYHIKKHGRYWCCEQAGKELSKEGYKMGIVNDKKAISGP